MIYCVDGTAPRTGCGSPEAPFRTIGEAARAALPGDEIVIAPGIYRESVDPPRGGTPEKRIVYRAKTPGQAVLSGAEILNGWTRAGGDVWKAVIRGAFTPDDNPYTDCIDGDWFYKDAVRPLHRGQVFADDRPLIEADAGEISAPTDDMRLSCPEGCWRAEQTGEETAFYVNLYGRDPRAAVMEYTARRTVFHPEKTHIDYITLSGLVLCKSACQWAPPTARQEGLTGPNWAKGWVIEDCEVYGARCVGITVGKHAEPDFDNEWTKKRRRHGAQTQRDTVLRALNNGWSKETIGWHVIRRCHIHDCGQAGIAGHMGGAFSVIEDNRIHHINMPQELQGAEIGGIKLHAAIDTVLRNNRIHHCTRGIWLDWQAQGTRVTGNILHHNEPPRDLPIKTQLCLGEDLFVEVSHGPTLIDHNLLLSPCAGRVSTQGIAFAHNLIAGSLTFVGAGTNNAGLDHPESARYTPYHEPHDTKIAGFMTILHGDARFYNNIFVQQPEDARLSAYMAGSGKAGMNGMHLRCGTAPYDGYPTPEAYFARFTEENVRSNRAMYYDRLPVYAGGNVYFNGARPCGADADAAVAREAVGFRMESRGGAWYLITDVFSSLPPRSAPLIDTDRLGKAFESDQAFDRPDGGFLTLDRDMLGVRRGETCLCGPFETPPKGDIALD